MHHRIFVSNGGKGNRVDREKEGETWVEAMKVQEEKRRRKESELEDEVLQLVRRNIDFFSARG